MQRFRKELVVNRFDGSPLLVALLLLMVAVCLVAGIGWLAVTHGALTFDCSFGSGECGMTVNG